MAATAFFGYASKPYLTRETLSSAIESINAVDATPPIEALSWESLQVAGRVIIKRILAAIDASQACVFDVTTLNENVLFELGYAIAKAKPILVTLDRTDAPARRAWTEFRLLKGVGYSGWANSDELQACFWSERPDLKEANLYDDLIEPTLEPMQGASIFYVQSYHPTDAAKQISRRLDQELRRGVRLTSDDPTESSLNSLEWYASKVYSAECVIVHFDSPRRDLANLHNPRSALIAGLAVGLDRPVLMLAEEDYSSPLDYEDYLQVYGSKRECAAFVDAWLQKVDLRPKSGSRTPRLRLAGELRLLRFGEHVAENERDTLSDYFIETSAFTDVLADRTTLFVGRKGTGKTATMYQAASRLAADARNLVVIIKPPSYEFSSLLSLLGSFNQSLHQYSIEALWKFLLVSEIANAAVEILESRPRGVPYSEPERRLLEFVDAAPFDLRADFSSRFERTVAVLSELGLSEAQSDATGRDLLNEALHSQAIAKLRSLLGAVLTGRRRVAVLIDNLDKGWDRTADLDTLSQLLLGLLSAIGRVQIDFSKESYWRDKVSLSVATFLRSDIYEHLRTVAREPDKILGSVVTWTDPEVLIRVLEERFLSARPDGTESEELWARFVAPTIDGQPAREWIVQHILPRPRDLIFLANNAVIRAIDRGHDQIDESDWHDALLAYSQFAFEALLVENGITIARFKDVLYEFLGGKQLLTEEDARAVIRRAGTPDDLIEHVLLRLKEVAFLGIETADDRFEYPEAGQPFERATVQARRVAERSERGTPRLRVHPAYKAYLEIS